MDEQEEPLLSELKFLIAGFRTAARAKDRLKAVSKLGRQLNQVDDSLREQVVELLREEKARLSGEP